jgi:glycosyltransferase involved in cell wall biosynthesis
MSSVLLNLTNKDYAIETFGLTTLEALTVGLPVIVPTVGGIAEMVEDGVNGYKIDVTNLDKISETLIKMLTDINLYRHLAINAIKSSGKYREKGMIESIVSLIEKV